MVDGRPAIVRRGPDAVVGREAEALRLVAGIGVPAVLADDAGEERRLALEVAPPLPDGLDDDEVRRVGAVLATALARAHAAGVVHGPMRDGDLQAGPLLGGWAGARLPGDATGPSPADDVAALAAVLLRRCGAPSIELRAILERAASDPTTGPTAAGLADALTPSRSGRDLPPPARRIATRTGGAVIAAVVIGLGVGGVALAGGRDQAARGSAPASAAPVTSTTDTTTTAPPRRAIVTGNVVTFDGRKWHVGEPGDVVVAGDWDCDGADTVALLRPGTGEIWSFPEWTDGPTIGQPIATVAGAHVLRAVPTGRCDDLQAVAADGTTTWVAVP